MISADSSKYRCDCVRRKITISQDLYINDKKEDLNSFILTKNHGPFTWGKDADAAVYHSVVLEKAAEMALKTLVLNPNASIDQYVLDSITCVSTSPMPTTDRSN